jgi:hypothetical protein
LRRYGCGVGRGIPIIKDDRKLYFLADSTEREQQIIKDDRNICFLLTLLREQWVTKESNILQLTLMRELC